MRMLDNDASTPNVCAPRRARLYTFVSVHASTEEINLHFTKKTTTTAYVNNLPASQDMGSVRGGIDVILKSDLGLNRTIVKDCS